MSIVFFCYGQTINEYNHADIQIVYLPCIHNDPDPEDEADGILLLYDNIISV